MSVYAVYSRASADAIWSLLELYPTQEEADQFARSAIEAAHEGGPQAAVVVEWDERERAPAHLPEQWIAPVVSHYGGADVPMHEKLPQKKAAR